MTSKNTARKSPVTHQDLLSAYLMAGAGSAGVAKISAMLVNHTKPVDTLDRVINPLAENDQDTDDLAALRAILAARKGTGKRGRQAAKPGDVKIYIAQSPTADDVDGDVFLRLPLKPLGARKGEDIRVSFGDDGVITVERQAHFLAEA